MKDEIWKDVPEYEGLYQISNFGRLKNMSPKHYTKGNIVVLRPHILVKTNFTSQGKNRYLQAYLNKEGHKKIFPVHYLVLYAFEGARPKGYQVNHKNGIKNDNRLINLEYVTPSENMKHAYKNNLAYISAKCKKIASENMKNYNRKYSKINGASHGVANFKKANEKRKIKIHKYDLENNLICIFESCNDCIRKEHATSTLFQKIDSGKPYRNYIYQRGI